MDELERRLDVMERMLNISAKPEELKEYRKQPAFFQVSHFVDFVKTHDEAGDLAVDQEVTTWTST